MLEGILLKGSIEKDTVRVWSIYAKYFAASKELVKYKIVIKVYDDKDKVAKTVIYRGDMGDWDYITVEVAKAIAKDDLYTLREICREAVQILVDNVVKYQ